MFTFLYINNTAGQSYVANVDLDYNDLVGALAEVPLQPQMGEYLIYIG